MKRRIGYLIVAITCLTIAASIIPAFAATRTLSWSWSYPEPVATDLAGFTIYMEGTAVADIKDSATRAYTGEFPYKDGKTCYTIDAYDAAGNHSAQTPCTYVDLNPATPSDFKFTVVVDVQVVRP